MTDENALRTAAIGALVLNLAVAGYHRLQARTGEKISHQEEGWITFAIIRLSGLVAGVAVACNLLVPGYFAWDRLPLPWPARWLGLVMGYACAGLMYWTMHALGTNLTDTVVTRQNATLVTSGPYQWVRHPFYWCAGLLFGGFFLITTSGMVAVSAMVLLTMLIVRTENEERHLEARFGQTYRDYQRRTGKFFPRKPLK